MMLLAAAFPAFLSVFVAAQNNDITLDIINAPLAPDGFTRSTVSADGTFPGPLIRAGQQSHSGDFPTRLLHRNNFWVIKSNGSDIVNTVNPIRRDVSGAGAEGTTVRFTTDRPVHCRIFWHMNAGLASVVNSGTNETRASVHPTGE
ncbi:hypothetical protein C8R43DRAFT_952610 [Mycena crocata]|nr:hypothetical protein C8R43DRAFT_952610 [Mycena crocata]